VYLLGRRGMDVDATVLASAAIAGLARGASYPLVMLDRFHRERERHPNASAESLLSGAIGNTGRALLYAGAAMIAALLVIEVLGVTNVVATLGIGALLATALATGAAVVVVPAGLALFGDAAVKWRFPAPAFGSGIWNRMVAAGGSVTRYPLAFVALATAALVLLAVPALAAETGSQDVSLLPADNQARIAFEQINHVMGPGYLTPYQVTVYNPKGPITSAATLSKLHGFEAQIAKDVAVKSVVGPGGSFYSNSAQLGKVGPGLQNSIKVSKESLKGLTELINGLGLAGAGSTQLQAALSKAAGGAGQLHTGSRQAASGAGLLRNYLAQAHAGQRKLTAGLDQMYAGANALKAGADRALSGANQLAAGLGKGAPQVTAGLPLVGQMASAAASTNTQVKQAQGAAQSTQSQITAALQALNGMGVGKTDANYLSALAAVESANSSAATVDSALGAASQSAAITAVFTAGVNSQIRQLAPQLTSAASGSAALAAGIKTIRNGNAQLASAMGQAASGGTTISSGLGQLTAAAGTLQTGLDQLTGYLGELATGLAGGVPQVGQLTSGLATMQSAVIKSRGKLPSTKDLENLFKSSPGLFSSGYFVLAAVAGAPPADRNAAKMVINLTRGGNAGQILVTSRFSLSDSGVNELGGRLRMASAAFAKSSGLEVLVGGPAGNQWDTANATTDKLARVIIGEVLVTALLLMLLLRAILIPAVATLTAALTTAAGFGVMQLLFGGVNPPLGGSGTWYSVIVVEVLGAIYGATLVYIVVLMTRARDYFVTSGDARGSLLRGMRSTIAATTGMAAVTIGVLIPFMFTAFLPIRMIAVAAALAVGLIAFVVVPVLLPAAMSLLGRAGWWPTQEQQPVEPAVQRAERRRRAPRLHIPHRGARPAH
jgi:X-X-X-Leu-X-X-Gly heptad repeat protein